ncbi:flagellar biosynthetic protein FliO [Desulfobaculum bizertense]|uniref:Flagellar protein n=1 Tax=Desulfobaculum bizertense DSM 18034 TaxID=1121442 RepID=A0A1T4X1I8_9BACT|nr:flagellar biosynthetic protein FliO [Desulfobaculum bizertense]UIJ37336.1 flagellar biosynthetic protein FliO [Desulfobaculum bizertense]SKA82935.1 flagellar protein FliO/FliZ [Desulfobaculum bizertense DSM 18034]
MKSFAGSAFLALAATVALPALAFAAGDGGAPAVPDFGVLGLRAFGSLCLVLALLLGGFWIIRRVQNRTGLGFLKRKDLQIVAQLPLGGKRNIIVVRFLNKLLVLGVCNSSINVLTETEISDDDTLEDFSETLENAKKSLDS